MNTYILGGKDGDRDLVSISGVNESLEVSTGALLRDPAGLLGVIRLGLELHLQLIGDDEPWGWIRIGPGGLLDMAGHSASRSDVAEFCGTGF